MNEWWAGYFLSKFYLYWRGTLRWDLPFNLLFLFFLVFPFRRWTGPGPQAGRWHSASAVLFAGILLWHDSFLPPLREAAGFVQAGGLPTKEFLFQFFPRFVNPMEAGVVAALFLGTYLLHRRIRWTPVILVLMVAAGLRDIGVPRGEMDRAVAAFYRTEAERVLPPVSRDSGPDFDLIILHVCSLSLDDLKAAGMEADPFFDQFDLLLDRFNTVTSYSNPSAIRLLRSGCGQTAHDALYRETRPECLLADRLRSWGFDLSFVMNHDGVYGNFAEQVRRLGDLPPPRIPRNIPVLAENFDGTPIYGDFQVLESWWNYRKSIPSVRAALYYNSITLHDGAHPPGQDQWWQGNRTERYRTYVRLLFSDLTRFFHRIRADGRRAVVIFVPEHGLGLRGEPFQPQGLRDIPLPQLTTVPVGVKFIGPGGSQGRDKTLRVDRPVSYWALSSLVSGLMAQNPFGPAGIDEEGRVQALPGTDFLAENQGRRVIVKGTEVWLYGKDKRWVSLSIRDSE